MTGRVNRKKIFLWTSFVIVLALAAQGTYYLTSQPYLCTKCHEVEAYVPAWEVSPHRNVTCLACHQPRGPLAGLHSKSRGANYFWQHVSNNFTVPTRAFVSESNCIACHYGDMKSPVQGGPLKNTSKINHYEVITKDESCLDCHRNVGHEVKLGIKPTLEKTWKSTP